MAQFFSQPIRLVTSVLLTLHLLPAASLAHPGGEPAPSDPIPGFLSTSPPGGNQLAQGVSLATTASIRGTNASIRGTLSLTARRTGDTGGRAFTVFEDEAAIRLASGGRQCFKTMHHKRLVTGGGDGAYSTSVVRHGHRLCVERVDADRVNVDVTVRVLEGVREVSDPNSDGPALGLPVVTEVARAFSISVRAGERATATDTWPSDYPRISQAGGSATPVSDSFERPDAYALKITFTREAAADEG